MQTNDSEEEEIRRPIYSRDQEPDLNWRQSSREPSLAERSNMRSEAARNNYPRSNSTSPRTFQTTIPSAPAISSTRPSAPTSHPSNNPSAPSAQPSAPSVTSSSRGSSNRRNQPSRYNGNKELHSTYSNSNLHYLSLFVHNFRKAIPILTSRLRFLRIFSLKVAYEL